MVLNQVVCIKRILCYLHFFYRNYAKLRKQLLHLNLSSNKLISQLLPCDHSHAIYS